MAEVRAASILHGLGFNKEMQVRSPAAGFIAEAGSQSIQVACSGAMACPAVQLVMAECVCWQHAA